MNARVVLLGILALVSGCAQLPSPPNAAMQANAEQQWALQQQRIAAIRGFDLRGRVAGGVPKLSAHLIWTQQEDGHFDLRISAPLGIGALRVVGDASAATITRRQDVFHTTEPERWLEEQTGLRVPLQNLRWWIRGLPAPDTAAQLRVTQDGQVRQLQQSGWNLAYTPYAETPWGLLPRRLDATHSDVTLTVLIDQWSEVP